MLKSSALARLALVDQLTISNPILETDGQTKFNNNKFNRTSVNSSKLGLVNPAKLGGEMISVSQLLRKY